MAALWSDLKSVVGSMVVHGVAIAKKRMIMFLIFQLFLSLQCFGSPLMVDSKKVDAEIDAREMDLFASTPREDLPHWTIDVKSEKHETLEAFASYHEGDYVRDESYHYRKGKLFAIDVASFWDMDKPPEKPSKRRYYFSVSSCLVRTLEKKSAPLPCKSGLAEKLRDREKIIEKIYEADKKTALKLSTEIESWPN